MYQPVNSLNVSAIKNLNALLKAPRVCTVAQCVCVRLLRQCKLGLGAPAGLVIRSVPLDSGAVTWVSWPLGRIMLTLALAMKSDWLTGGKQKGRQSKSTRRQQEVVGQAIWQSQHRPSYVILMTEGGPSSTARLLMVSKCLPVKKSPVGLLK